MTTADNKKLASLTSSSDNFFPCNLLFEARGWNTLLVFALAALVIWIEEQTEARMKCYSVWHFVEFFFLLVAEFKSAIEQQWDLKKLRALISFLSSRNVEDFLIERKFLLKLLKEQKGKTHSKVNGKFFVLWILNWQFARNCILFRFFNATFSLFSCRTTCGSNGIFSRRLDFSLYNVLPKQRINSIEVKVIMQKLFIHSPTRKTFLKIINCSNYAGKCCEQSFETSSPKLFFPLLNNVI